MVGRLRVMTNYLMVTWHCIAYSFWQVFEIITTWPYSLSTFPYLTEPVIESTNSSTSFSVNVPDALVNQLWSPKTMNLFLLFSDSRWLVFESVAQKLSYIGVWTEEVDLLSFSTSRRMEVTDQSSRVFTDWKNEVKLYIDLYVASESRETRRSQRRHRCSGGFKR